MLRPLLRDKKNCYSTLDIETGASGQVLDIAIYDGTEVRFFESWKEFLIFLKKHKSEKVYQKFVAHSGGKFDYVSLVEFLNKQTKIKYEVLMSQSKIVVLYIFLSGERIEFIDSSNVFLGMSLHNLCSLFNIKHKKLEGIDRKNIEKEKYFFPDKYYEYLKRDVLSLYEICKAFEKYLKIDFFPTTLASLSLYLYRRRFQKHILFRPSDRVDEFISQAYAGGRVEVFRPGKHDQVNIYDVNSLYPYVMKNWHYPIGTPVLVKKYHPDKIGVYKVKFNQKNESIPPLLWVKNSINGLEFVYSGEGYFFNYEIQLALENDVEIEVEKGYVWLRSAPLFKEFVDYFYNLRLKNEGNALAYLCKIILNSLYGKFGQKENKYVLTRLNYNELIDRLLNPVISIKNYNTDLGLYEISYPQRINHRIINLAAQVTALGRTVLNREIIFNADNIVYCDTDSIHIKTKLEDNKLSKALGAWKLENSGEAIYTGRKQYSINNKIRYKGMKIIDNLGDGERLISREDMQFIADGGTIQRTYSYFPSLKAVLEGKKACKIYKLTKIGKQGSFYSNFKF